MRFDDVVTSRRSIRKYLDKDVSFDDINKIIEFGILAPSAHNRQPWKVKVVRGEEKDKIVFHFGGNTTNRTEAANGYAKIVTSLIAPENSNKTTVYSFMYKSELLCSDGLLSKAYVEDALTIAEKIFIKQRKYGTQKKKKILIFCNLLIINALEKISCLSP